MQSTTSSKGWLTASCSTARSGISASCGSAVLICSMRPRCSISGAKSKRLVISPRRPPGSLPASLLDRLLVRPPMSELRPLETPFEILLDRPRSDGTGAPPLTRASWRFANTSGARILGEVTSIVTP